MIEIPFKEHSFQVGDFLYSSSIHNQGSISAQNPEILAQIESIPTGMITSADYNKVQAYIPLSLRYPMNRYCSSRSLDELLGYVDLQVLG